MKVKIIFEFNPSDLENSINKFLKSQKIKLVDIKFGGIKDCAVLIIYEEI
ncbi:hypothetical protein KST14_05165 [Fusobacterium animalis]